MGLFTNLFNSDKKILQDIEKAVKPIDSYSKQMETLSDEQLKILADHGGIAGLNLCPAFLHDEKAETADEAVSRIEDMVRHVMHIYRTAGADALAIGTDFDGIGGRLDIRTHRDIPKLFDALMEAGLPASAVDKLAYANAARVLSSTSLSCTQDRR